MFHFCIRSEEPDLFSVEGEWPLRLNRVLVCSKKWFFPIEVLLRIAPHQIVLYCFAPVKVDPFFKIRYILEDQPYSRMLVYKTCFFSVVLEGAH